MSMIEELQKFRREGYCSFHMPGHNYGKGVDDVFAIDVTELPDTDNLAHPEGMIERAQRLAAEIYGAEESFMLVNGSTAGMLSAVYGTFVRGETVLVDRMCHQSVLHAIILAGLQPVFLMNRYSGEFGLFAPVCPEELEKALTEHPEAAGAVVTSPNYYGLCTDIAQMAGLLHQKGLPLLVDEAHGAHFPFHSSFPKGAVFQGADAVVNSLHKTLPSPNQTAVLHIQGPRVDRERIRDSINVFQTSSPSYVLLAYAERALEEMRENGKSLFERQIRHCRWFAKRCRGQLRAMAGDDPIRLVINLRRVGADAQEVYQTLYRDYRIALEAADRENLIAIVSAGNTQADFERLYTALMEIVEDKTKIVNADRKEPIRRIEYQFSDQMAMKPEDAFFAPREEIAPEMAMGCICARPVVLFPPGIMLAAPGERLTEGVLQTIHEMKGSKTLWVIKDNY